MLYWIPVGSVAVGGDFLRPLALKLGGHMGFESFVITATTCRIPRSICLCYNENQNQSESNRSCMFNWIVVNGHVACE